METLKDVLKLYPQLSFRQSWILSSETLYMLGQCDAIVQSLLYLPLSPEIRNQMLKVSLIKGALATTAIEGNTLSESEVAAIEKGTADIPPSRKYQEREVKNVLDALNGIRNEVIEGHKVPTVTTDLILAFHAQIGKDLGQEFQSVPGKFRPHEVTVGTYRPPDHRAVPNLVDHLCAWLHDLFGYAPEGHHPFLSTVVEAVVAHVYLVWIHPFGDGNGRTARLLEFFILLRGGLPDICSHILSNHYNATRPEYYRHLSEAGRTGDLSSFIEYAVTGLLDGVKDIMSAAQVQQIRYCWEAFASSTLGKAKISANTRERLRTFLAEIGPFGTFTSKNLPDAFPKAYLPYAKLSPGTLLRDLQLLVSAKLLERMPDNSFRPAISPLVSRLPATHSVSQR